MPDVLTPEQRRYNMSRIRNRNTRPEMIVRSLVHRMGYRYRLHRKDLPGKPDLVFPSRRKIIFVHGCFFHMHDCSYGRVVPKTNAEFWRVKRLSNVERDKRNVAALKSEEWEVFTVWECMTKPAQREALPSLLTGFLTQ
jgi:DNA mismatch endonuclease (patch repair protein)